MPRPLGTGRPRPLLRPRGPPHGPSRGPAGGQPAQTRGGARPLLLTGPGSPPATSPASRPPPLPPRGALSLFEPETEMRLAAPGRNGNKTRAEATGPGQAAPRSPAAVRRAGPERSGRTTPPASRGPGSSRGSRRRRPEEAVARSGLGSAGRAGRARRHQHPPREGGNYSSRRPPRAAHPRAGLPAPVTPNGFTSPGSVPLTSGGGRWW